jgi:hypothetical protein
VETFAAVRLEIQSWRWSGVPFLIRAGKCLPVTTTEVLVQLRKPPLDNLAGESSNHFRFRLGPGEISLSLSARVKRPGEELVSMNMWGFLPSIFPLLSERFHTFLERSGNDLKSEHYVPTAVNELVSSGQARVKVLRTNNAWFGVTYREGRPRVVDSIAALVKKGKYPEKLWN